MGEWGENMRAMAELASTDRAAAARSTASEGEARFSAYVAGLRGHTVSGRDYPGLRTRPVYDPTAFAVVAQLEAAFDAIAAECGEWQAARSRPEREAIARTGRWDVVFLHGGARRNAEALDALPTLARIVDTSPEVMRNPHGACYLSRLAPRAMVAPHRGPTNLRARCHLPISVPSGDVGLSVEGVRLAWRQGTGLVFSDRLTHQVWNHTSEERIVLVVDLWHPDLTDVEVARLGGLFEYVGCMANEMAAFWTDTEGTTDR